jgi:Leucine-rich repeat (LRR) protein
MNIMTSAIRLHKRLSPACRICGAFLAKLAVTRTKFTNVANFQSASLRVIICCWLLLNAGCDTSQLSDATSLQNSARIELSASGEPRLLRAKFIDLTPELNRQFADMNTLEEVEINESRRDGSPLLSEIARLPQLQTIRLNHVALTDAELEQLSGAQHLTTLELSQTGIQGEGLKHLSKLPIKRLLLCDTSITAEGLASLTELKELEELELYLPTLSASSIPSLAALKNLKKVHIIRINFNYRLHGGLNCFEGVESLEELRIHGERLTSRVLRAVAKVKSLKSLTLDRGLFVDEGLEALLPLEKLENLEIHECVDLTDRSLSLLAMLPNLKSVQLSETKLSGLTLPHLAKAANLKNVAIYGKPIATELIEQFKWLNPDCLLVTSFQDPSEGISREPTSSLVSHRAR